MHSHACWKHILNKNVKRSGKLKSPVLVRAANQWWCVFHWCYVFTWNILKNTAVCAGCKDYTGFRLFYFMHNDLRYYAMTSNYHVKGQNLNGIPFDGREWHQTIRSYHYKMWKWSNVLLCNKGYFVILDLSEAWINKWILFFLNHTHHHIIIGESITKAGRYKCKWPCNIQYWLSLCYSDQQIYVILRIK